MLAEEQKSYLPFVPRFCQPQQDLILEEVPGPSQSLQTSVGRRSTGNLKRFFLPTLPFWKKPNNEEQVVCFSCSKTVTVGYEQALYWDLKISSLTWSKSQTRSRELVCRLQLLVRWPQRIWFLSHFGLEKRYKKWWYMYHFPQTLHEVMKS